MVPGSMLATTCTSEVQLNFNQKLGGKFKILVCTNQFCFPNRKYSNKCSTWEQFPGYLHEINCK